MSPRPLIVRMMQRSVRAKLIAAFTGLIALLAAGAIHQFPQRVERHIHGEVHEQAQKIAAITAYSVSPAVLFHDSAAVREILTASRQGGDIAFIRVADLDGGVLAAWPHPDRHLFDNGNTHFIKQHVLDANGRPIGYVDIGMSLAELRQQVRDARIWIFVIAAIVMLLSGAAVWAIANWITKPLRTVVSTSVKIAAGDLSARTRIDSKDEVGALSRSFDTMVEKLSAAQNELLEANRTLEARVEARTAALRHEEAERLRAELALLDSERRFRVMFDSSAVGMALFSCDGALVEANPAFHTFTAPAGAPAAAQFADFVADQDSQRARQHFDDIAEGALPSVQFELLMRTTSRETIWGHAVLSAVVDNAGPQFVIAMIEDISQQKRIEELYRQSQKMEAVGRLAGGIAHDFNNLLTTINGVTDLLLEEVGADSPLRPDLEQIIQAGDRAATLTRQLLAFGRKQLLRPALVDVNAVINDMSNLIPRVIGEHIQFVVRPHSGLASVLVDKTQLEQVILNLVVNARDAMPTGGRLTIETSKRTLAGVEAEEYEAAAGEYVQIAVSDTGVGMDAITAERIFEPFFTTKPIGQGTGLGLATVYGIVKQTGGGILVDTRPGHGATFRIVLPAQHATAAEPDVIPPVQRVCGHGTLLLVEDEETVRRMFSRVLSKAGYNVLEARNGVEALLISQQYRDEIDIVVSDVIMPGMNGPEAVRRILAHRPSARVLYVSGYTENEVLQHGVSGQNVNYLQKPISPANLTLAVSNILASSAEILPQEELVSLPM